MMEAWGEGWILSWLFLFACFIVVDFASCFVACVPIRCFSHVTFSFSLTLKFPPTRETHFSKKKPCGFGKNVVLFSGNILLVAATKKRKHY